MWRDAAQPESESRRGKRARRKKSSSRSEEKLRLCAALHIVRTFLPGRGKAPHHVL